MKHLKFSFVLPAMAVIIVMGYGLIAGAFIVWFGASQQAKAANFSIQTGYYMGTGTAGLAISGLGFQPDTVMIKSSTTAGVAVFKTSSMPATVTAFTSALADNTASNIQFTSDGFTLGTLANVNSANVLYYWTAFTGSDCSASGNYCVGVYTGNGSSSRAITTGFQPGFVMVKRSTAIEGNFRTGSEPVNESLFFGTTARVTTGTHIASFASSGFTVGSTNNANGGNFYYIAFKDTAGVMSQGTYTGNATDNRNITGVGFQPDLLLVKNATSATTANRNPLMAVTESYGDSSSFIGSATANTTNGIQALQSDGFQVGSAVQANESGAVFYWVAFGGAGNQSGSESFTMDTGSYTGTGASLPISLDFAPDLVIIKDNNTNYAVFRTRLMAGDTTAYLSNAAANFTGGITSLDSNGFTVGGSTISNTTGNTYHWQAFGNAFNPYTNAGANDFAIGAFYGNGIDNRDITRLPFQPNLVAIKRSGASAGVWRTSAQSGDLTAFFGATAETSNVIQLLASDGFQVGTNAAVNTAANLNYWFAFKNGSNFAVGSYTGTGTTQTITAPAMQPDTVWVKRSTAVNGVLRGSSISGDATQYFANLANTTGRVTGFVSNGFSVTGTATETNASGGVYRYATWRIPPPPVPSFDIVDASGQSVPDPDVSLQSSIVSFDCSDTLGTLGTSNQRLRITNPVGSNPTWTLTMAATAGATARWQNSGNTQFFDFNDSGGTPAGCSDSALDTDSLAGRLSIDPSSGQVNPQSGCSNTDINFGTASSYAEDLTNTLTLVSAGSGALTGCYWDITDIGVSQRIPSAQPGDTYSLDLTLTITAF